jgi:hypothetical protein
MYTKSEQKGCRKNFAEHKSKNPGCCVVGMQYQPEIHFYDIFQDFILGQIRMAILGHKSRF